MTKIQSIFGISSLTVITCLVVIFLIGIITDLIKSGKEGTLKNGNFVLTFLYSITAVIMTFIFPLN